MIDLKAARNAPDEYRAALARTGAAAVFDELLAADERWRAVQQQVDEMRARTKLKGKPSPEQLEELTAIKEQLQPLETELARAWQRVQRLLDRVPNPPAEDSPDGTAEEDAFMD
jgi:seryl-tRNA synthetase